MNLVDVILVTCIVAAAAAYIAWALLGQRTAPPCHNVPATARADATDSPNVIVGASLQRGLDRARRRARAQ